MDAAIAIAVWLSLVVVSIIVTTYLAHRWGHDPFGWVLLSAAMGPIAILAIIGTRQRDARRETVPAVSEEGVVLGSAILATDGEDGAARLAHHIVEGPYRLERVAVVVVLPFESKDNVGARGEAEGIAGVAAEILQAAGLRVARSIRYGSPGEEVVRLANEAEAPAVFVGRRGSGLSRALLGSVSDYVVRHSTSPVIVVSWHD